MTQIDAKHLRHGDPVTVLDGRRLRRGKFMYRDGTRAVYCLVQGRRVPHRYGVGRVAGCIFHEGRVIKQGSR